MTPPTLDRLRDLAVWLDKQAVKAHAAGRKSAAANLYEASQILTGHADALAKPGLFGETVEESTAGLGDVVTGIVAQWNKIVTAPLPKARLTPKLRRRIAARMKDSKMAATGAWTLLFTFVNADPWFRGDDPKGNGWKGDLPWLVETEDRVQRYLEKMLAKAKEGKPRPRGCTHAPVCTDAISCTRKMLRAVRETLP